MRVLISLAALAERCASSRTSWATTAKPLPASPARAASTPAFSARRFVWNEISSMTEMIWVIFCDDSSMAPIAFTASVTTSRDRAASAAELSTMALASSERCAESLEMVVISSTAAAVSSRAAACCSVLRAMSSVADVSSRVLPDILLASSTICENAPARLPTAALKLAISPSNCGAVFSLMLEVRSPFASLFRALLSSSRTCSCSFFICACCSSTFSRSAASTSR